MTSPAITPAQARAAYEELGSQRKAGEALGVSRARIRQLLTGKGCTDPQSDNGETFSSEFGRDTAKIFSRSVRIKTLDDALTYADVDLEVWEVDRYLINKWEVGAKQKDGSILAEPLFQVKVWLKRRASDPFVNGLKLLTDKLPAISFKPVSRKAPKDPHMGVLALYDAHFAKLAWAPETGENYDLKEAARRYKEAGESLVDRAVAFGVEVLEIPVGQDFFHINDFSVHTPRSGNELDVDSRLPKIFEAGAEAVLHVINYARERIQRVIVRWVPGNHAPLTSFFLCQYLAAYFRNANNVQVDVSPAPRKYISYGRNLLGLAHGGDEKMDSLPTIMASEMPAEFGLALCREFLIGHTHKKREWKYLAGDTFNAVAVITIPSLGSPDYWHYMKGYVKTTKAAELHLYSKHYGKVGQFSCNVDMLKAA